MLGKVKKFTNEGLLVSSNGKDYIIPRGSFDKDTKIGDEIDIFYEDGSKTAILEKNVPQLGKILTLRVKDKSRVGYFLDTGLSKDLFLSYNEVIGMPKVGDLVVCYVLIDFKGRLTASMKISDHLSNKHSYKENDVVSGVIYNVKKGMGVFVVVDGNVDGRLDSNEMNRAYFVGDRESFRVKYVLPDGKLSLTKRERSHIQIDSDGIIIMDALMKTGRLDIGDKSSPEKIYEELGLSKQAFKRACGRLLKEGYIKIGPFETRRVEDED